MKIGFVSTAFPQNLEKSVHGIYKRMGMFIQAMKDMGELDMLFYVDEDVPVSPMYIQEMQERLATHWGAKLTLTLCHLATSKGGPSRWQYYVPPSLSVYKRPEYSRILGREQIHSFHQMLSRNPDIVFAHRLGAMCVIMLSENHLPPIFFDLDDVEHIAFARSVRQPPWWWAKWLQYFQVPSLLLGERRAISLARRTFVCSEKDRNYLQKIWRLKGVVTIPNAISIPESPMLTQEATVLFLGSYAYRPNVVAAEFLIEHVWPRINREMPNARLIIAGGSPEKIRFYNVRVPNVEFTGFVENLSELYGRSRIVCSPVFSGGGTRIKIIEAAAFGKAIVSTRIGAEGIEMADGVHLLIRDDAKSFAEACLSLLKDNDLCERLGKNARILALQRYDRKNIVELIQRHFRV